MQQLIKAGNFAIVDLEMGFVSHSFMACQIIIVPKIIYVLLFEIHQAFFNRVIPKCVRQWAHCKYNVQVFFSSFDEKIE